MCEFINSVIHIAIGNKRAVVNDICACVATSSYHYGISKSNFVTNRSIAVSNGRIDVDRYVFTNRRRRRNVLCEALEKCFSNKAIVVRDMAIINTLRELSKRNAQHHVQGNVHRTNGVDLEVGYKPHGACNENTLSNCADHVVPRCCGLGTNKRDSMTSFYKIDPNESTYAVATATLIVCPGNNNNGQVVDLDNTLENVYSSVYEIGPSNDPSGTPQTIVSRQQETSWQHECMTCWKEFVFDSCIFKCPVCNYFYCESCKWSDTMNKCPACENNLSVITCRDYGRERVNRYFVLNGFEDVNML